MVSSSCHLQINLSNLSVDSSDSAFPIIKGDFYDCLLISLRETLMIIYMLLFTYVTYIVMFESLRSLTNTFV